MADRVIIREVVKNLGTGGGFDPTEALYIDLTGEVPVDVDGEWVVSNPVDLSSLPQGTTSVAVMVPDPPSGDLSAPVTVIFVPPSDPHLPVALLGGRTGGSGPTLFAIDTGTIVGVILATEPALLAQTSIVSMAYPSLGLDSVWLPWPTPFGFPLGLYASATYQAALTDVYAVVDSAVPTPVDDGTKAFLDALFGSAVSMAGVTVDGAIQNAANVASALLEVLLIVKGTSLMGVGFPGTPVITVVGAGTQAVYNGLSPEPGYLFITTDSRRIYLGTQLLVDGSVGNVVAESGVTYTVGGTGTDDAPNAGYTYTSGTLTLTPTWLPAGTIELGYQGSPYNTGEATWQPGVYPSNPATGLPDGESFISSGIGWVNPNVVGDYLYATGTVVIPIEGIYWLGTLVVDADLGGDRPRVLANCYGNNTQLPVNVHPAPASFGRDVVGRAAVNLGIGSGFPATCPSTEWIDGPSPRVYARYA